MSAPGIPFMITIAMKEALRERGLSDEDIRQMVPEDAHKLLLTPNPQSLRPSSCWPGPRSMAIRRRAF
jgi:hypothetical protein